jgi:hypothetical protein
MKKHIPLAIGLLAIVFLLAFAVGQGQAQEGRLVENNSSPGAVEEKVGPYIPVQGRLTDASGNPLNGDYDMTFRLYAVLSGGTELCHDTNVDVHVDQGLFNSEIWGTCPSVIDGEQLYLGIEVESDGEMSPRQPIYAVPYAWSLRPGAVISGTQSNDAILHIENWGAGGRGLRAYAMTTTGANYGVTGASRSVDGYGGYFYNNGSGVGLKAFTNSELNFGIVGLQAGYSEADLDVNHKSGGYFGGANGVVGISHETVQVGAGVFGWAQSTATTSYGVRGQADSSTNGYGVFGQATASTGNTRGVYGVSASTQGQGVYGYASAASGTTYGVYGESNSPNGHGVHGVADVLGGVGVWGESEAATGVFGQSTAFYGVYGLSTNSDGVYGASTNNFGVSGFSTSDYAIVGNTARGDQNYGVYTGDNLYSLNYHTKGATMQVVQNGGSEPLEAGDVVVFSGMVAPTEANEPPVILVSKASSANSNAVAGVVFGRYSLDGAALEGAAQQDDYLLVVVQGPARVKVSAVAGAIQPGDLLSSSAQAGVAASAARITIEGVQTVLPGTVFAKALEALESGEGWIYVFVTLQ